MLPFPSHASSLNSCHFQYVGYNSSCHPLFLARHAAKDLGRRVAPAAAGTWTASGSADRPRDVGNDVEGPSVRRGRGQQRQRRIPASLPPVVAVATDGGVGAAIRNARSNTNDCRSEHLHRIFLRIGRRRPRASIFKILNKGCCESSFRSKTWPTPAKFRDPPFENGFLFMRATFSTDLSLTL